MMILSAALGAQPPAPTEPPAVAEKPLTIATDRPSFDDTTAIAPLGHVVLETGYTFTLRDRDGVETHIHNFPEVMLRVGIIDDRLELRLGTSGYVWVSSEDGSGTSSDEGFSDLLPGIKFKTNDQDGAIPRIALELATTVGTGSNRISTQEVEPIFKFIWSYDLGEGWGIYGNLNTAYPTTAGERFLQGQGGVCVTYAATDRLSFFGEYFLFGPAAKGADAAHYLDFGTAYLITPRIQLDARAGFGLNDEANNFFTGFGISFLF